MVTDTNSDRLNRIEEKIDKLSDAMILMVRAEEKLIALEAKHSAQYDRMNRFSEKLDGIEKKVDDNARTVQTINKLFWVIAVSVIGAIAAQLFM
jgi:tetrahydromethanopterin S-methyltransferase subunit G